MYYSSRLLRSPVWGTTAQPQTTQYPGAHTVQERGRGPWWSADIAVMSIRATQAHLEGGAISVVSDEITVPVVVLWCQVQPWDKDWSTAIPIWGPTTSSPLFSKKAFLLPFFLKVNIRWGGPLPLQPRKQQPAPWALRQPSLITLMPLCLQQWEILSGLLSGKGQRRCSCFPHETIKRKKLLTHKVLSERIPGETWAEMK